MRVAVLLIVGLVFGAGGAVGCSAVQGKVDDWRTKSDPALAKVESAADATAAATGKAGVFFSTLFPTIGGALLGVSAIAAGVGVTVRAVRKPRPATAPPTGPNPSHDTPGGAQLPTPADEPGSALRIGPAETLAERHERLKRRA